MNWELWWPNFPILVYFKETQTKPEGQVHFFPVIFVSNLKCHAYLPLQELDAIVHEHPLRVDTIISF